MKAIQFLGGSLAALRRFPDSARREAGYQLDRVQRGLDPVDWKPFPAIGQGVREIRIHAGGEYRIIIFAKLPDRIAVIHAFCKKSRKVPGSEIRRARMVFKAMLAGSDS